MSHSLRQNMDMTDASPTLDLVPGRSYYEEEEEGWGYGSLELCGRADARVRSVLLGLPRVTVSPSSPFMRSPSFRGRGLNASARRGL